MVLMRQKDIERFSRWASGYENSRLQRFFLAPAHTAVLDTIAALEPRPRHLLDVGCGTGALLRAAASRFPNCELCGVDPAPGMIKVSRKLTGSNPRLRFREAPAQRLPFEEGCFDLVVSTLSFHHWGDHARGVHEVMRVLKPGGFFVLADIFAVSWARGLWLGRLVRSGDYFHTRQEMESLFGAAGLQNPRLVGGPSPRRLSRCLGHLQPEAA